ncbi:unnamed protein product [Moneuplotes crassus]|uniref:Phosphatidylinositol-4-phosphate 5-kinase n=2 Tax=Euplotes crassus TaxID=5936 RepID=A0AAD1UE05_EUPCR|nr:unnamed protein product [Moneuplotes crassus]
MEINYENADYYGQVLATSETPTRSGKGVLKYHSGRVYQGYWANDQREGEGYEKFENGNIYKGNFQEGRAHGKGVYTWVSGECYEGEWVKGHKHGKGIWKGHDGEYFMGDWKRSKPHGYGMHIWKNGDRYEGEWQKGLKSGSGTDIFKNGDVYVGEYHEGKFNGKGKFVWSQGMAYEGEFKDGMRHGQGIWRESNSPNATSYEGSYFNDKKHGEGVYKWRSGSHYKGNFYNDQRDGYGEMYWIDGSSYKGQWEKGAQRGEGLMAYSDKEVKIVETNSSRNPSIANNELYNSNSLSQSENKAPPNHNLLSEGSLYNQSDHNQEHSLAYSDQKNSMKMKLINQNKQAFNTSNGRFRIDQIDEKIRETKSINYRNFIQIQEGNHKRILSKQFPRIPPMSQVTSNIDYESVAGSMMPRRNMNVNKILASTSHYTTPGGNRSFDISQQQRINTGNKSFGSLNQKRVLKNLKYRDLTTEPKAVIKILRKSRKKKNKGGHNFKIRSNSHVARSVFSNYTRETKNAYLGLSNNTKKKQISELYIKRKLSHRNPWRPSGLRDALFNKPK